MCKRTSSVILQNVEFMSRQFGIQFKFTGIHSLRQFIKFVYQVLIDSFQSFNPFIKIVDICHLIVFIILCNDTQRFSLHPEVNILGNKHYSFIFI